MPKLITKVKTNTTKGSICDVNLKPILFSTTWDNYPDDKPYIDSKTGKPPKGYENQCAIKVSVALHKSGVEMKSFKGKSRILIDGKNTAAAAEDLSAWLKLRPFCGLPPKPETITGKDWEENITGRTGIIFFKDYWMRDGETESNRSGDHIDLWNGSRLTASGIRGSLTTFVRFNIGISHIPHLYSDLSKSKQILFWEIK
jgi:hypothetical protein